MAMKRGDLAVWSAAVVSCALMSWHVHSASASSNPFDAPSAYAQAMKRCRPMAGAARNECFDAAERAWANVARGQLAR